MKKFREKPNKELAEKYIEQGNYLWNSGMFVWKTEFILSEIKKHMETHKVILENIVIVNTKDALLVCHKDKSQEVKKILNKIELNKKN